MVEIIKAEDRIIRTTNKPISTLGKRWKSAQTIHNARNKIINFMVEHEYKQILELAKALYSTLPDGYSKTVYERDHREDNTENALTMHVLITPTFYWYLECSFAYHYQVEYNFFNCPFEAEIRDAIQRTTRLPQYSKEVQLDPNCEGFLKRVFEVQDKKYKLLL